VEDGARELPAREALVAQRRRDPRCIVNMPLAKAKVLIREKLQSSLSGGPAEMRRCFQHFDRDGSGHISLEELKTTLRERLNIVFDDEMLQRLMADYDDNAQGEIDYRKFVRFVMDSRTTDATSFQSNKGRIARLGPQDHAALMAMMASKVRNVWKSLRTHFQDEDKVDGNRDGNVSEATVVYILQRHDIDITPEQLRAVAASHYTPSRTELSYRGFMGMFRKGARMEDIDVLTKVKAKYCSLEQAKVLVETKIKSRLPGGPGELRRCFKNVDSDGSGTISLLEFKNALYLKANLVFEEPLLRQLFQFYDDDSKGEVDFRKFCARVMGEAPPPRVPSTEHADARTTMSYGALAPHGSLTQSLQGTPGSSSRDGRDSAGGTQGKRFGRDSGTDPAVLRAARDRRLRTLLKRHKHEDGMVPIMGHRASIHLDDRRTGFVR